MTDAGRVTHLAVINCFEEGLARWRPSIICDYSGRVNVATSDESSGPVGVRDLKNSLSAYLDLVKSGQEIVVTEHGRPIARLSPVSADVDRMAALVKAGIVQMPRSSKRRLPTELVTLDGVGSLDDDVAAQRR